MSHFHGNVSRESLKRFQRALLRRPQAGGDTGTAGRQKRDEASQQVAMAPYIQLTAVTFLRLPTSSFPFRRWRLVRVRVWVWVTKASGLFCWFQQLPHICTFSPLVPQEMLSSNVSAGIKALQRTTNQSFVCFHNNKVIT